MRRESPESWLAIAGQDGMCCEEREGKRIYLGSMVWEDKKLVRPIRVVYQVIERMIEADGQILLTPSEQFHSELKTDLNLERRTAGLIIYWTPRDRSTFFFYPPLHFFDNDNRSQL